MTAVRIRAFAAPAAFSLLAFLLAGLGKVSVAEVGWTVVAVVLAFGPSGWIAPAGWRRWVSEALLLPTALVMTLIAEASMRQMLVPPLLLLAAWAALSAGLRRRADLATGAALIAVFGLTARAAIGSSLGVNGWTGAVVALVVSAVVPFAVAVMAPVAGVLAALLISVFPLQERPVAASVLCAAALVIAFLFVLARNRGVNPRWFRELEQGLRGWLPAFGAVALVGLSLGSWGPPPLESVLQGSTWVSWVGLSVILAVTLRLFPAAAGASTLLVCLLFGVAVPPTPEGGAVRLSTDRTSARLRTGNGGPYVLHLALGNGMKVEEGTTVAWVHVGKKRTSMRAGRDAVESSFARATEEKPVGHSLVQNPVWRPPLRPGKAWRVAGRVEIAVPQGVSPVIERHPGIPEKTRLLVSSAGPVRPASPRNFPAEKWLWLAAAVVALVQLASGTWALTWAWPSWMLLTAGLIVSRMSVEPLHLLLERYCVDLCLAAVLVAWAPAAVAWMKRGRLVTAVAWLLVPLALATPSLTPPLWGDEPFHLALMESLVDDGDLELANNLHGGGGGTAELILGSENFFHSPVLGFLLLPGFWVGGRAGALVMLALAGALTVGLIGIRLRRWLDPPLRVLLLVGFGAVLSYPLATFSTQVWPGIVGMIAVAGCLVLVSRSEANTMGEELPRRRHEGRSAYGRWIAAGLAFVAVAVKTRFALMVFPVAAAGWWRREKRWSWQGPLALGGAAVAALAVGWVTMGHPFGPFRRLHHLLPSDIKLTMTVVGGLLFDVAGGLAWMAPLWLLALVVVPGLWRCGGKGERALILGGAATLVFLLHSTEWYGGGSPPGRYLVALLPGVWLALGLLLASVDPLRKVVMVLFPPSLLCWWVLITRLHFTINSGDGFWWLTNALSRRFSADASSLFPSFLVPSPATVVVPGVLIFSACLLWWVTRSARRARTLLRLTTALWLLAATGLVAAVDLRRDGVVEAEAPQVRRHGGTPVPPIGTPARYSYLNGRRLADGDGLTFPLQIGANQQPVLVGQVDGSVKGTALLVRWDQGEVESLRLGDEGLVLPPPPSDGRQRLNLIFQGPPGTTLVVDKVVVQ
ncbi:MAG: hypothetical protein K8R59_01930 [Thermoanaerobaculales bacterium]|nr:hypothetical protein [Thermoanaerobaculales bacterium]